MNRLDGVYGLSGFSMNFGLERIKALMRYAGNPQDKLNTIHIAGTNGKGSTSRFIYGILKEHGLKVGLYTSPHLVNFSERIVVGGEKIKDDDIERLHDFFNKIISDKDIFEKIGVPSFFEITTAICFQYFFENKVDIAVIETGLGGRLDATNIIKKPLLSVITNISMDHSEILGNSLEKIAAEKAGIIKKKSIVLCGDGKKSIRDLIKEYALKLGSAYFSSKDVKLFRKGAIFTYKGLNREIKNVQLQNFPEYQQYNLKLSLLSLEILGRFFKDSMKLELDDDLIRKGISKFKNEGRFEIIKYKNRGMVLDGAHNAEGIKNLVVSLQKFFKKKNFIIIFGVMRDKDYKTILKKLSALNGKIIFTRMDNGRALDIRELKEISVKMGYFQNISLSNNIKEAIKEALKSRKKTDTILICGSLYLIGEFKKLLLNNY